MHVLLITVDNVGTVPLHACTRLLPEVFLLEIAKNHRHFVSSTKCISFISILSDEQNFVLRGKPLCLSQNYKNFPQTLEIHWIMVSLYFLIN